MDDKFLAVVIAGVTVFGLAFVLDHAGTGGDLLETEEDVDRMVLHQEHVGTVGRSSNDFRTIELGDFNVGRARGDIRGFFTERAEIEDRLFGSEELRFSYDATTPNGGEVTFNVLGREGTGAVYLDVNGERVFEEAMVSGSSTTVTIPERHLRPGENEFKMGVSRPGIFASSKYYLEDVELRVNDRQFHDHVDSFRLFDYEIEDFVEADLQFDITRAERTDPLRVFVNDQKLYEREQQRISPEEIELNPQNANLVPGSNTISFRTRGEARYDIENAMITMRYLGNIDSQNVVLGFRLNDSQRQFVDREDTREEVLFDYQNLLPSPRPIEVRVNDFSRTIEPRENRRYNVTVPEGELEGANRLEMRSNGTYELENVEVVSERIEEDD